MSNAMAMWIKLKDKPWACGCSPAQSAGWLPKGMSVQYMKTCKTDLVAECTASETHKVGCTSLRPD